MSIRVHFHLKQLVVLCVLCFGYATVHASSKEHATQQLSEVKQKMIRLEASLHQELNHREQLTHSLASTEKAIGEQIQSLRSTQQVIVAKNQSIRTLTNELHDLNEKLDNQRAKLIQHLRFRYMMGHPHPSEWLLNPQKPHVFSRFITYYQYLIQSDKKLIQALQDTKKNIEAHQQHLSNELAQLSALEKTLTAKHQALSTAKGKHQQLIQQITQHIQTKQQQLVTFKQDQARLQALIEQLSRVSFKKPAYQENHKLAASQLTLNRRFRSPLSQQRVGKPYNQGILFSAKEGTVVTSILPGQVVFSDWLNGYGLLLIIDHGHGMMSLYAHNESLFKKKGMSVQAGEEIATVGHTGGIRENGLYFELRQRGKIVPPRQWLA